MVLLHGFISVFCVSFRCFYVSNKFAVQKNFSCISSKQQCDCSSSAKPGAVANYATSKVTFGNDNYKPTCDSTMMRVHITCILLPVLFQTTGWN